ncbi:hypothetical protein [Tenacibaculum sp. SDUM215027]
MLKNISILGSVLNKKEQQTIKGGYNPCCIASGPNQNTSCCVPVQEK